MCGAPPQDRKTLEKINKAVEVIAGEVQRRRPRRIDPNLASLLVGGYTKPWRWQRRGPSDYRIRERNRLRAIPLIPILLDSPQVLLPPGLTIKVGLEYGDSFPAGSG